MNLFLRCVWLLAIPPPCTTRPTITEAEKDMKNYTGRGGCYPRWQKAELDNMLRGLHNFSHHTKAEFNNCLLVIQNISKFLTCLPPEVYIIFHIIRKPNSIIVLLFIQNISKFLTCLPPEVYIIFHIIRKPNSIIVLLFIQNISKFLTCLPPEVYIIFHIIRKPNSIIVLLFIQNISKFLTCLPPCSARFQDTNGYFILRLLLKKYITSIEQYVLCILAFVPFSISQKFSYFVFE